MYSFKVIDEFIYNKNKDVAIKLVSKSVFSGDNIYNVSKFPYFEVWILQSQYCNVTIANTVYELYKGDVLVFSENDTKDIAASDNNAVFLSLQIDASAFTEILPFNTLFDEKTFFKSHSRHFKNKIASVNPTAKIINENIYKMIEAFSVKRQGYEVEVLQLSLNILLTIARETNYHTSSEKFNSADVFSKTHKSLKKAIDYIDSHLGEELSLEKISSIAELSPNYFSNIFREQTGVKLWDYIGEKRIIMATQLLIEYPNDSIISIALKCGFNNCPNINKAFKKFTGQTPKKYKTSMLRQEENL